MPQRSNKVSKGTLVLEKIPLSRKQPVLSLMKRHCFIKTQSRYNKYFSNTEYCRFHIKVQQSFLFYFFHSFGNLLTKNVIFPSMNMMISIIWGQFKIYASSRSVGLSFTIVPNFMNKFVSSKYVKFCWFAFFFKKKTTFVPIYISLNIIMSKYSTSLLLFLIRKKKLSPVSHRWQKKPLKPETKCLQQSHKKGTFERSANSFRSSVLVPWHYSYSYR